MSANHGSESERHTRRTRIAPRLRACGWQIVTFDHRKSQSDYDHHAIEEYPTSNGPADYALIAGGQLLGVVEAKKDPAAATAMMTKNWSGHPGDAIVRAQVQATMEAIPVASGRPVGYIEEKTIVDALELLKSTGEIDAPKAASVYYTNALLTP